MEFTNRHLTYKENNIMLYDVLSDLYVQTLTPQKLKRIEEQFAFQRKHLKKFNSLTKREIEIIKWIVKGLNNPQIADKLFISRHTVQQHRKNINRKLDISSFSDLFQYALAFDLM